MLKVPRSVMKTIYIGKHPMEAVSVLMEVWKRTR